MIKTMSDFDSKTKIGSMRGKEINDHLNKLSTEMWFEVIMISENWTGLIKEQDGLPRKKINVAKTSN